MGLEAMGLRLAPDFANVEALQEDKKLHAEVLSAYVTALSVALRDGVITGDEYREQLAKIVPIDAGVTVKEVQKANAESGAGQAGEDGAEEPFRKGGGGKGKEEKDEKKNQKGKKNENDS
jgi:hypothetical protein